MAGKNHQFSTGWLLIASAILTAVAVMFSRAPTRAASDDTLMGQTAAPVRISAEWSQEWSDDHGTTALFRGRCRIEQGESAYAAESMVVWAHESDDPQHKIDRLTVYLEGDVRIDSADGSQTKASHWLELDAARGITLKVRGRVSDRPGQDDPLFKRAVEHKPGPTRSKLQQTQMTVPASNGLEPTWRTVQLQNVTGMRRIRVSPRSFGSPLNITSEPSKDTTPVEQVTSITGGVNILVEGIGLDRGFDFGVVDLMADNAVVMTEEFSQDQMQRPEQSYQVYLEGNIVIRQRDEVRQLNNVIRASRAFYDARDNRALILDAELETYVAQIDSSVRMRADRIRQNSLKNYHAQNAWITTSQYGVPGYRLQASDLFLENRESGLFSGTAAPRVDPKTGTILPDDHYWVTAVNSQFLVDQFPLFNAPQVTVPIENISGSTPLQSVGFGVDRIFGVQVRTTWDPFALLGIAQPENPRVRLGLHIDEYSLRGPSVGLSGGYNGTDANGHPYVGSVLGTYINDGGRDNLGRDRRSLIPPDPNRGIFQWEHRQDFADTGRTIFAEIGWVSDRNYRESFRESEFDKNKDLETKLQINQIFSDSAAGTLLVSPQLNNFENNTQWLPRGDLYFLGEPLLGNWLNYSSHSSAGYATLNPAATPTDPREAFSPLPYMTQANGLVAQTRHEVELPFNLGAVRVAPFLMGEQLTVADLYLMVTVNWTKAAKIDLARWPGLAAFRERMRARPAVQAALEAEGLLKRKPAQAILAP